MKENGIKLKEFEEILKQSFIADGHIRSELLPKYFPLPCPIQEELFLLSVEMINRLSSINNTNAFFHANYDVQSPDNNPDIVNPDCSLANITLHNDECNHNHNYYIPWPFNLLPECVGLRSHGLGSTSSSTHRALRKELQVQSMLRCIIPLIPSEFLGIDSQFIIQEGMIPQKRFCIVDFAGGTGTLAIVLALLLPQCDVIVVDLKASSLHIIHEKTQTFDPTPRRVDLNHKDDDSTSEKIIHKKKKKAKPQNPLESKTINSFRVQDRLHQLHRCEHIHNLYTYYGSIEAFSTDTERPPFHLGICLHGCGEASDLVLRSCGENGSSFVVCPCCVGKLNRRKSNPYIFQATATDIPTVSYPQSQAYSEVLTSEQFDVLAGAGDYSDYSDMHSCKYSSRRTAKGIIEMDRLLFMKETYGYDYVALTKMEPFEASPKNDIVMGWKSSGRDPFECFGGFGCISSCVYANANADVQRTFRGRGIEYDSNSYCFNSTEWTDKEEKDIRSILQTFLDSSELVFTFPRMGPRLRKLVHFLSYELGLTHWSHERTKGEIAVVVKKLTKKIE